MKHLFLKIISPIKIVTCGHLFIGDHNERQKKLIACDNVISSLFKISIQEKESILYKSCNTNIAFFFMYLNYL